MVLDWTVLAIPKNPGPDKIRSTIRCSYLKADMSEHLGTEGSRLSITTSVVVPSSTQSQVELILRALALNSVPFS